MRPNIKLFPPCKLLLLLSLMGDAETPRCPLPAALLPSVHFIPEVMGLSSEGLQVGGQHDSVGRLTGKWQPIWVGWSLVLGGSYSSTTLGHHEWLLESHRPRLLSPFHC